MHIHLYRSVPLSLFFPRLARNLLEAYAKRQRDDGYIPEALGDGCSAPPGPLDASSAGPTQCGGRLLGDTASAYLLAVYQSFLGDGDLGWLRGKMGSVAAAVRWQALRSEEHGLPSGLGNTYDW